MSVGAGRVHADDQVGPLFDWYSNGDVELGAGGKVSHASAEYVRPMRAGLGALVIGRHLFDIARSPASTGRSTAPPVTTATRPCSGKRYFGSVDAQQLLEDPHTVIRGDRELHLLYRVCGGRVITRF
jgi:hypothetical protein